MSHVAALFNAYAAFKLDVVSQPTLCLRCRRLHSRVRIVQTDWRAAALDRRSPEKRDPAKSCPHLERTDQPFTLRLPQTSPQPTMPYFMTSAEWLEQSSLLLKARPTSVRARLSLRTRPAI